LSYGARLVVAVEPDPVNAVCFGRTFASEIADRRVRLVEAAAWHSPGSLKFELGDASQTGRVASARSGRAVREANAAYHTFSRHGFQAYFH
jgi:hypothetical protein